MSKDMKSVYEMVDYVRQLRLHTEGRRAIHVRLSLLEKHLRDEHGRRFVAATLRPLITGYGATMFALPNTDVVLIVKDAPVDSIDILLAHVRKKFKTAAALQDVDPVQGQSDVFVEWFDLEESYTGFRQYIEYIAEQMAEEVPVEPVSQARPTGKTRTPGMLELESRPPERVAPSRGVRMVPIDAPTREEIIRDLDPTLIVSMAKALVTADVEGLMRKQKVMAIIGQEAPHPVMEHRFVPISVVFEKLLATEVRERNRWLEGYLEDLLAGRMLIYCPSFSQDTSLASSLRVSCHTVVDPMFDGFDKSLGSKPRSTVILEFGATDVMTNFGAYRKAHKKAEKLGFRFMVGDIDPRALLWLNYKSFEADFVKLRLPKGATSEWLDLSMEEAIREQIHKIGVARIVLDGCGSDYDIEVGQRLGITLFQGDAVSEVSK